MVATTRERLIAAAASLLDSGGPEAVTMRAVGDAAGVSHNAAYKHFLDKDDLLAAVAAGELQRHGPPASGTTGDLPTARELMIGYVHWASRYPERFKLTFGRWTRANPGLKQAAEESRASLVAAVVAGQQAGELPAGEPERLAALLLALAHGAADLALSGHLAAGGKGKADPEDLVVDLCRYLESSRSNVC